MKKVVIIQPSLRKESYTDILCKMLYKELQKYEWELEYIDLREKKLEFCDGGEISEYSSQMQNDYELIKSADAIIFGFPIYHFAISGVLKNYIDILGDAMQDKKIDFLVTAIFEWGEIAHEHILESFQKKYNVSKIMKETVYVLNSSFTGTMMMDMIARKNIQILAKNISKI